MSLEFLLTLLAFPPDPWGCFYGFGINDLGLAGAEGSDFLEKVTQMFSFCLWDVFQLSFFFRRDFVQKNLPC